MPMHYTPTVAYGGVYTPDDELEFPALNLPLDRYTLTRCGESRTWVAVRNNDRVVVFAGSARAAFAWLEKVA